MLPVVMARRMTRQSPTMTLCAFPSCSEEGADPGNTAAAVEAMVAPERRRGSMIVMSVLVVDRHPS